MIVARVCNRPPRGECRWVTGGQPPPRFLAAFNLPLPATTKLSHKEPASDSLSTKRVEEALPAAAIGPEGDRSCIRPQPLRGTTSPTAGASDAPGLRPSPTQTSERFPSADTITGKPARGQRLRSMSLAPSGSIVGLCPTTRNCSLVSPSGTSTFRGVCA